MMRVAFATLGCKVNQYETEAISELFASKGYKVVEYEQVAEIYIINTCTVTNFGDKKSRQTIRKAKRQNSEAIIVVTGCYAQTAPEEIKKIEGVNIIVGTKDRTKIVEFVENYKKEQGTLDKVVDIMKVREFEEFPLKNMKGRTRAYLKIQDGCNQFCSYCIIPYARGTIRSRLPEDILLEVKNLVKNDFKEIVLTGIHVASYGKDLDNIDLLKLTKMVHNIDGIERIRFSSIEPNVITEEFLEGICKLHKVCEHIHLSLQSGCDETLRAMNRKYTTKQYYDAVFKLRHYIPNVGISTDIIVGFPGETDENFESTCKFVKSIGFSKVHVFPYSSKKGTLAANRIDQIKPDIKDKRTKIMLELEKMMALEFLEKNKNRTEQVLFEQEIQKNIYEGYTSNYIKVIVNSDYSLKNKIIPITIKEISDTHVKGVKNI